MTAQAAIQKKLSEKLTEGKFKNPAYSVRALARRLGVSPATLSRLLSGSRRASPKLTRQIIERLGLSPSEADEIVSLLPKKRPYRKMGEAADSQSRLQLTMDQYHVVSDWFHFGIRSLLRTADAQSTAEHSRPEWLAMRLGITATQARTAVERLLRLEMIERLPDGSLRATDTCFHSPDGTPSVSIRHNHAQHLELARASLERDSVNIRDFTNLTLAINPEKLPEAKDIIRRFRKDIETVLEEGAPGSRQEVYSLAIQLFPLTRITE